MPPGQHISACRSHTARYQTHEYHILYFTQSDRTVTSPTVQAPPAPDISTFQEFWKVYPLIEWEDFESQPKSVKLSLVYQDSGDF